MGALILDLPFFLWKFIINVINSLEFFMIFLSQSQQYQANPTTAKNKIHNKKIENFSPTYLLKMYR